MAGDGYNLEVDATLNDTPYRSRLKALVTHTKAQGATMAKHLTVTPVLNDKKFRGKLASLNAKKLTPKNASIGVDTKRVHSGLAEVDRRVRAMSPKIKIGADGKLVQAEVEAMKARIRASNPHFNVMTNTQRAEAQVEALKNRIRARVADMKVGADTKRLLTGLVEAERKVAATQADIKLRADGKMALADVEALKNRIRARMAEIQVGADTKKGTAQVLGLKRFADSTRADIKVGADTKMAMGQLAMFGRGIDQLSSRMGRIAMMSAGIGTAIGAVGMGVGMFGMRTAAALDSKQFAFTNLMGGPEQAAGPLKELKQVALNTPFDLNAVYELGFRLKSAGRDTKDLTKDVMTLSDGLAATGGGAMQLERALFQIQQIRGRTKLFEREDLRPITNAIPGFMQAYRELHGDRMEFDTPEETMQAIFSALENIPGARGMSEKAVEETFQGRFSKFRDQMQINFAEAFIDEKESIFEGLDIMSDAIGVFLESFAPVAAKALGAMAQPLADLLVAVTPILVLFTEALPKMIAKLVPWVDKASNAMERWGWTSDGVASAIAGLIGVAVGLKVFSMLAGLLAPFASILAGLFGPKGILASVGTLLSPVIAFFQRIAVQMSLASMSGVGFFKALAGSIGFVLLPLIKFVAIAALVVGAIAAVVKIVMTTDNLFASLRQSASSLWNQMRPGVALIGSGLRSAFDGLRAALTPIVIGIVNFFKVIADTGVVKAFVAVLGGVVQLFGWIVQGIGNTIGLLSKIPFLNKIMGDSFDEVGKSHQKNTKLSEHYLSMITRVSQAVNEQIKSALDFGRSIAELAKSGLPEINTESLEKMGESMNKRKEQMQKNMDDIKLLMDSGFTDLVMEAEKTGGATGLGMIATWADAIRNNKESVLLEHRQLLKDIAAIQASQKMLQDLHSDEIATLAFGFTFTPGSEAGNLLQAAKDELSGTGQRTLFDEMEKNLKLEPGSVEEKLFREQVKEARDARKKSLKDAREAESKKAQDKINNVYSEQKEKVNQREKDIKGGASQPTFGIAMPSLTAITGVADKMMEVRQNIMDGAGEVYGSAREFGGNIVSGFTEGVSGLGGKIGEIVGSIGGFVTRIREKAGEVFSAALSIGSSLISGIVSGISGAAGNIASALIGAVKRGWNSLAGSVTAVYGRLSGTISSIPGMGGLPQFEFPRMLQSGTQNFGGGLAVVGERGRELVHLPQGSKVTPADKTKKMLDGSREGDTFQITVNGIGLEQAVSEMEAKIRAKRRQVFI